MNNGIIILALGHPWYGRYAHNLSVSIKRAEPDMPIALVWAGNALDHLRVFELGKTFDHIIEAPYESYTRNGRTEYIRAKTFLYDLSPFDETIFLDADTLWLPQQKPSELFEKLSPYNFSIQNTTKHIEWANLPEIREAYNLKDERYIPVSSEFIYFKKENATELLFDYVKDNYDYLKVKMKTFTDKNTGKSQAGFAGGIPDELPFSIAMMQMQIYPHEIPFVPVYWQTREKKVPELSELYSKYYAISCGGKVIGGWTKKIYDRLVQRYFHDAGLRYIWKLQHKRSFLPERSII